MTADDQLPALLGMVGARRFAQGGMADLFVADKVMPKGGRRRLVVKRMQPQLSVSEDLVARFRDEARLGLGLRHSNIVRVLEYHEIQGQHYMLMEAIDGVDLAEIMTICWDRGLPFPQDVAAYFMQGVASALAYMADARTLDGKPRNLVHRDISPSNVLVTTEGVIKLIDFGVAKSEERESSTKTGGFVGKYAYMSPEQVRGDAIDIRSDLFALGAVTYGLLAARMAFQGSSGYEIMDAVVQSEPFPLEKIREDVHPVLAQVVRRCLKKDPADRYAHPIHLVEDLNGYFHVAVDRPPASLAAEFIEALGLVQRELTPTAPPEATAPGYDVMAGGAPVTTPLAPPGRERTESTDIFAGVDPPSGAPALTPEPDPTPPPEPAVPTPASAMPRAEPTEASEAATVEPPALREDPPPHTDEVGLPSIESTLSPLPGEPPPRKKRGLLWAVLIGIPVLLGVAVLVVLVVGGALYLAGGQDAAVGAPPTGVGSTSATETPVGAATDPAAGDPSEATPAEEKTPAEVAEETTPEPPTPPPASATGGGSEPKTTGAGTRPHGGKFRGRGSDEATPAPSGEPADDGSG